LGAEVGRRSFSQNLPREACFVCGLDYADVRDVLALFSRGSAAVIGASSLTHARLLAVLLGLGRPFYFVFGYIIHSHHAALIPEECKARLLSRTEAQHLYDRLFGRPKPQQVTRMVGH
jgi:hypothetical protein